jgi:hypothetical protein
MTTNVVVLPGDRAVLDSTTSSLSIAELGTALRPPGRLVVTPLGRLERV